MSAGRTSLRDLLLPALAVCGALVLGTLILDRLAGGIGHIGELAWRCLLIPFAVFDVATHAGTIAVGGLVVAAAAAMTAVLVRQGAKAWAVGRAVGRARLSRLPAGAVRTAAAAGVLERVDVVVARRPFAFVYGWWRPRICVSTGLLERLTDRELEAVLLHERWHLVRRDPARLLVVRSIRAAFGFVPVIREVAEGCLLTVEIAADRHAVRAMGHPRWLAGALLKAGSTPMAVPAFEGQVERRVAALVGESDPPAGGGGARRALAALLAESVVLSQLSGEGRLSLLLASLHPIC